MAMDTGKPPGPDKGRAVPQTAEPRAQRCPQRVSGLLPRRWDPVGEHSPEEAPHGFCEEVEGGGS